MEDTITKTKVANNKRQDFLPSFVGRHFLAYENMVFDRLKTATKSDYQGGYWEFYTLSNGGFIWGWMSRKRLLQWNV